MVERLIDFCWGVDVSCVVAVMQSEVRCLYEGLEHDPRNLQDSATPKLE